MEELLSFFDYKHLPVHLQEVSLSFHDLAHEIALELPPNREQTAALRKLLEAKDCAIRAEVLRRRS